MCSLVVARDGNVHVAQRRVRVAQSNGWQVHVRGFREGLVVSPGIGDHQKKQPLEAARVWLVKVLGVKWAAGGVADVAAANFSTALWPVFLKDVTLVSWFLNGNNGTSHLQKLLPGPRQI